MRGRLLVLIAVGLLVSYVGVCQARRIAWQPNEKPPVSLRLALTLAEEQVASHGADYHCVSARLAKTFSDGDWAFQFHTPDGKQLWGNVSSARDVRVRDEPFEY